MTNLKLRAREGWRQEVQDCNHEWVTRLIKYRQAKIPSWGFYLFHNPYLEEIIEKELSLREEEVRGDVWNTINSVLRKHLMGLIVTDKKIYEAIGKIQSDIKALFNLAEKVREEK